MNLKKVAIIGKPNVGKSRLFNRISKHQIAIVLAEPGITRDRIVAPVEWLTRKFELIDTGGISNENLSFQANINEQAQIAAKEADLVLFVVSYQDGITNQDVYVAKTLKKLKPAKVFLVINKTENVAQGDQTWMQPYYQLGFGAPYLIAAEHGIGIGDLLDATVNYLQIPLNKNDDHDALKFSLIGKPNVGKSSLANALLNDQRLIVSDVPGTTRDAIDCYFTYHNEQFGLIDTAGIRRAGKASKLAAEKFSVLRAKKAIARCDCILLVLDGLNGFNEQDEVIGGLAFQANIPTIIVVNKWDAVSDKADNKMAQMKQQIHKQFPYLNWAPIVFVSALTKSRLHTIFATLSAVRAQLQIKVATSLLEDVLLKAQVLNPVPNVKGQKIKLSYAVQVQGQIPTFVIFCNNPQLLHFSYARFIENQIRLAFGIDKVPITIYYKAKSAKSRSH